MLSQRWYANKAALPILEEIGQFELAGDSAVCLIVHLLLDHTPGMPALYQVPLSYRAEAPIGQQTIGRGPSGWITDAPHDPAFAPALLATMLEGTARHGWRTWARGECAAGTSAAPVLRSTVLGGEQSNTSIVLEREGAHPVIAKIFRALHHGENPDVVLQGALSAAGSRAVPRAVGHLLAQWPDHGRADGRALGHLAVAQEFLPGARDGWIVAVEAARSAEPFDTRARELGIATAGVHATLASTFPTEPMTPDAVEEAIEAMHLRLAAALAAVPGLAVHRRVLAGLLESARRAPWPARQRVHGDLHLGQVLDAPGRGWVMVDFEGEPLRPMTERSGLDNPLRDVAGMLRSFDYVAGSLRVTAGIDARAWAAASRAAYADGYATAAGVDLHTVAPLLTALEAEKALYEAVYEARNRPSWLPIPVAALERLAGAAH
jgi:predicted trehalose synthase